MSHGWFVAPMTNMPSGLVCMPFICVRNSLTAILIELLLSPPPPPPLLTPRASSSSKNIMQGGFFLACSNIAFRFFSVLPVYMSTIWFIWATITFAPASPAMAFTVWVFPVPGGPYSNSPSPSSFPYFLKSSGCCIASTTLSCRYVLTFSSPITESNFVFDL